MAACPPARLQHTTDINDSTTNWVNMQSITQENDLDAFLSTAQLAGTEFTAERLNVQVVGSLGLPGNSYLNPFLLTPEKEAETLALHEENKDRLTVPRRPKWTRTTTAEQLKHAENDSFLDWRRGLVFLEEEQGLIMTPYERNIEVWRQLWRVIERSDLVVQIVDARNPMLFRSSDLEKYVHEVSPLKKNLLLINKADLLTTEQREAWADYFDKEGVRYTFFSAALAKQHMEKVLDAERRAAELAADVAFVKNMKSANSDNDDEEEEEEEEEEYIEYAEEEVDEDDAELDYRYQESLPERIRIIDAHQLVDLLLKECPTTTRTDDPNAKINIGFVGYPNVGKSSTLNALVGAKRVAVGSTPGKTKHFQTIHLSDNLILCDCPGLVFPSFATTKAEMVINGVLPIDQLREYVGPTGLVCQRIPKYYLEALYGIVIKTRNVEGDLVDRQPTPEEFLSAYAIMRGFAKSSQGNPDEARAARIILKDYVNGKLLYVHPPPNVDGTAFNRQLYEDERILRRHIKKLNLSDLHAKANLTLKEEHQPVRFQTADGSMPASKSQAKTLGMPAVAAIAGGSSAKAIDVSFFMTNTVQARTAGKAASRDFTRTKLYPHQNMLTNDAKPAGPKTPAPLADSGTAAALYGTGAGLPGKKSHKKGKKAVKSRTQWTKDDL
ncbi:hypothetical protein BC831DRAFT_485586 [Entophlyctis helioformis]|nr:hypothetical protein BC831DRAFT_485586 [Entophlyctis helioformis]